MNIMKSIKVIGYGLWVMGMLLVGMPVMAQDWQSTSTMQGSGSAYSSQVTAVGAARVDEMATTTESNTSTKPHGPRRIEVYTPTTDPNAPLGDALIPLMLCACAYLIIRARKRANKGERANS